ncbi:MAG: type II secretion system protein [Rhodoferax sp.]|nr:type II secretion system protein [Rhodoferax sp.]
MKQRGFTLVEIAIVLVIVGLILGGILSSQSLIGSMKAKDVVAIVDDLRTASVYFKQRYNYLPGDWPYTANQIPAITAAGTGGTIGNGSIEGAITAATGQAAAGSEVAEAPWQLFNAGFISKIDATDTQRHLKTSYGAVHLASGAVANGLVAGFAAVNPAARNAIVFANLPCDVATEVDNKIDDGVLTTGRAIGTACINDATMAWYAIAL